MYNKVTAEDVAALKKIVGDEYVLFGEEISSDYGHDELGGVESMPEVLHGATEHDGALCGG